MSARRSYVRRGDGFELLVTEYPPVRLVIGTVDGVLSQVQSGAGAYVLLGRGSPRRCYLGRSENRPLPERVRASIRKRSEALGGVDGILTVQGAIPHMPWDEHCAAVQESDFISALPQHLINERRSHMPLQTASEEEQAARAVSRFVATLLLSRGYPRESLCLFGGGQAA